MSATKAHPSHDNYEFVLSDSGQCPKCGHDGGPPTVTFSANSEREWLFVSCTRCTYGVEVPTLDAE